MSYFAEMKTDQMEQVILVNEHDEELGLMEKMEAHEKALLHRAFSIFLFNSKDELLLQQRALHKYHSGGLWTNTCCSHPRQGESVIEAANRRLEEEMGMDCAMKQMFHFIYKAELDQGLTEHELDHVVFGYTDKKPNINPEEVMDWKYVKMDQLDKDIKSCPEEYTAWFKIIFEKVYQYYKEGNTV